MKNQKQPSIRNWSIVGDRRLVGSAFNRPGQADGKTIMTSPVLQVRLMGEHSIPVAFTESGSAYWLADPAPTFGIDAAESFVWNMSRSTPPASRAVPDPMLQTTVMRALELA
ncbi:MAG: hypothetical protein JWP65_2010 [Ramlibacter sp.]|jgi:hypothetical protein|uniref:hypothetical protein n=1 Tax=Ramlibacter sp. TaxID=1917967 RepID=UPI00260DB261|nr:hypothetical protein [Ramlibacter sp.]MDB5751589.1 hypothetical protein [Ramlibacter sp.]